MKSKEYDPEVQQASAEYRLSLPRLPVAGRSGELLARSTGSSLEFQEYREYLPGDDIRHLDWAAYARSDALLVRLYRDEISPRTEILLDLSRSMTTGGEAKPRVARQLAALVATLSAGVGGRPLVVLLDDNRPSRVIGSEAIGHLRNVPFHSAASLVDLLTDNAVPLKPQSVRVVVSDFLFPHDPDALVRRLATQASALWVIQLLNAWEANPAAAAGRHLIDLETAGELDLVLDRRTIAGYRERLRTVQEGLRLACNRVHARFVTLIAERGFASLCRQELCTAGLLVPAA